MAIISFKIRNTDNLTTEQVRGQPMHYRFYGNTMYLGTGSYADENYIYGNANIEGVDQDMMICLDSPSLESEEDSVFTIEMDDE